MKLIDYLAKKGRSQSWLGEQLGVTQSAVSQWVERAIVPAEHCPKIEKLTGGEVRCEEMNDKVDWSVLRVKPQRKRRKD